MNSTLVTYPDLSVEELRGFSRTLASIEWLLLLLVLLYETLLVTDSYSVTSLYLGMGLYAGFILLFRYGNPFSNKEAYWKLVVETVLMMGFITWVLINTGRLASPLEHLYLLVVISSSLMLGRLPTLVAMLVIMGCYVWLGLPAKLDGDLRALGVEVMARFAPLALTAYVTTMLSSDTRHAMSEIKTLSETDDLTGMLNRRAFLVVCTHTFNLSQRYNRNFSVVVLDSDSLKKVNDAYGHEAGNELLKLIAKETQMELRRPDLLARYGGDEFVLLLPDTHAHGAHLTAERIRARIAGTPLMIGEREIQVTVSMGVATYPEHGKDYDNVFAAADAALYTSKTQGKNRVTVAGLKASNAA